MMKSRENSTAYSSLIIKFLTSFFNSTNLFFTFKLMNKYLLYDLEKREMQLECERNNDEVARRQYSIAL